MRLLPLDQIQQSLHYPAIIDVMRDALIAHSRGECDTPMPMHFDIAPESAEVHMKSSYRRGGRYFALKIAGTFPGNAARGLSTSSGMILLSSAETGEPIAFLADNGHLTDVRTAAVAAMAARELQRADTTLGILGTGVQARLQARMHAEVLPLRRIVLWGRSSDRALECARDLRSALPALDVAIERTPAAVARQSTLIVTATPSREPLLFAADLQPATHISAVGADSPHKQELDPEILRRAALLLADSLRQCEKLGELQHAPAEWSRVIEVGAFCQTAPSWDRTGITVCDFTGLGVEDLFIAEYCLRSLL
ncbi:MAG TPA: ornithine cyclodeaminase family protein [Candidatus Sulfopaludibacter sp.]|jgi:ornithine cyclodeaminase|nr:ornithine cyclodeaminase family protein [Candidatus Sulfopaludibacter sp.]